MERRDRSPGRSRVRTRACGPAFPVQQARAGIRSTPSTRCWPACSPAAPPGETPLRHVEQVRARPLALGGVAGLGSGRTRRRAGGRRHRRALAAPGRGSRARLGRGLGGDRHRHGVGQVAGLPAADAVGGAGRHQVTGAVPVPHQGAGRRPAPGADGTGPARRPGGHPGRRHPVRGAGLDPPARQRGAVQPRPAAPDAAAPAPAVLQLPAPAAVRGDRRVPPLPRPVRLARVSGAAQVAPAVRDLRRRAGVRAGLGHLGHPGAVGLAAGRAAGADGGFATARRAARGPSRCGSRRWR